jgi:hypothetical protein
MPTEIPIQGTSGGGEGGGNGPKISRGGHGSNRGIGEIKGGGRRGNSPEVMPYGFLSRQMINDAKMRSKSHHMGMLIEAG